MQQVDLSGKAAVVTGGSRGIGLATAEVMVGAGADVLICGRSKGELEVAVKKITSHYPRGGGNGRVEPFNADVRSASQMENLMARVVDWVGHLDILVNNAGIGHFGNLAELTIDDWCEVLDTNLTGTFLSCHAAIPHLRQNGGGWIINISSLAGTHPFKGGSAYCASKAGLNALTETLMQEVRHEGIRVSCVAPGSVDTRFGGHAELSSNSWKLRPSDVARVVLDLLGHDTRSLPSCIELRPAQPRT